jgi:UDP-N-acetylglucosamine 1-carboxyvinyltransferase
MVRKMRASILVLGPMLARMGESTVSLPGGCAIGDRPIDLHLKALEAMGAEIELAAGYVKASAPKGRLAGGDFSFPVVSVGATENALMAAVLAKGKTQLFNAAREPEIVDLCNLLVAMGAKIKGIGSGHLIIDGVEALHGCEYAVMPDRIEAGSYACAAGITGGSIDLIGARPDDMRATLNALAQCGLVIEFHNRGIKVSDVYHCESGFACRYGEPGEYGPRVPGPAPEHATYASFASFADPDGNEWVLQEITSRLPGR